MADREDIAEVLGDLFEVTIGGDNAPLTARLQWDIALDVHVVKSGRYGTDGLAGIVQGRRVAGTLVINQQNVATLSQAIGLASSAPAPRDLPDVGSQLPTTTMQVHNPSASDDSGDLYFYAVHFMGIKSDQDGVGPQEVAIAFSGLRDSNGKAGRVGPAS